MVDVTNPKCNRAQDWDILEGHRKGQKNWHNVFHSSSRLEQAVQGSLKKRHFPIVFGGDHSQGIGSINGLKSVWPNARVFWVDAHIDANTPDSSPSGNLHGGPVAYLSGLAQYEKPPVLSLKDLIYFGIRSWEPEEMALLEDRQIPWYESKHCRVECIPQMKAEIERYFFPDGKKHPYWISFDIDGVDCREFASTGTPEDQGIPLDFMMKFFEAFVPEAVGMDFTEVNFELSSGAQTERDKQTVRKIIEQVAGIVHRVEPAYQLY